MTVPSCQFEMQRSPIFVYIPRHTAGGARVRCTCLAVSVLFDACVISLVCILEERSHARTLTRF